MKNRVIKSLVVICLLCAVALTVVACKGVKMTISFIVDGQTYSTIDTSGNEIVVIPQSPTKDGYTFDGWYWDNGTWQRPFTANSLLNEPLTADMLVYAKFSEIHTHSLTLQPANEATCTTQGNEAYYTCTCGKLFADEQGNQEITAIPTTDTIEHTSSNWITDSQPTCTANGSKHTECTVCHTTLKTETINANGHTPESAWKTDGNATCTENGSKHLECSVCHTTLQTETILSTGHTYSTEWTSDEHGHWHVATCEHTNETTTIESHTYDKNYKCKVCGYQDTSLHGTAIATEIFDVNGETLYAKVPNTQTTFSFINAIQVADDATFVVATDLAASNVIRTKTVSLKIGDNTYYILVENGNDIQLYTVTLRRRPIYTVTFATNGGTACDSQQVEEDSLATEPITTKVGYTFASWDYNFDQVITANTTITASWTANEYTITYDVNGGVLTETEYIATYDSAYTLAVPTREGHTFQGWYVEETKITNANGSSVKNWTYTENKTLTAKWDINSYTLTITNPNSNAGTVTGAGTKVYNSEVTVTATEPNSGYEWIGWYIGDELISTGLMCTFNMPATNLTLTPYKVKDEMTNFNFSSTSTTCNIIGVKDKTVTEIIIPEYITAINSNVFNNCSSLETVYWNANACTSTGSSSLFYDCSKLTTVVIADNVTTIPNWAFYKCSSLTSVYYNGNIESWCNIDFVSANANPLSYAHDLYLDNRLVTELVIPDTVTEINDYAFYGCTSITSATTGNSVTVIGAWAFSNCSNLTNVTIGDSVTAIDSGAFENCSNLTSIVIPESVTTIGGTAFYNCSNLETVYWKATACTNINGIMFSSCSQLTTVVIGDNVTTIPSYAFSGCSSLTSITIPDSVTSIGSSAFSCCSSLESITLPFVGSNATSTTASSRTLFGYIFGTSNYIGATSTKQYYGNSSSTTYYIPTSLKSVTITGGNILYGAFYNCGNLTSVKIPDSVTTIDSDAFENCSNLTSITIPDSVMSIGSFAFYNCSNLTSVKIPDSVTTIGTNAFYDCSNLTSVTIGNSVMSIGSFAFYNCSSLTSVYYTGDITDWCNISFSHNYSNSLYYAHNLYIDNELVTELVIPDTVTEIKDYAFYNCTSITSVTIGDGVETIGKNVFNSCKSLEIVHWNATACISVGLNTEYYAIFKNCSKLVTIVIGVNVTMVPQFVFSYCSSLTSVTISDSVTTIRNDAFYACNNITSIYYTGDLASWCSISGLGNIMSSSRTLYINNEELTGDLVIPDTVTEIKSYAFDGCTSIISVTIGNSVMTIDYRAFDNCDILTSVYYKGTADDWANISIGSSNSNLTNATRYYYSENEPELNADGTAYDGNYWYYNDDNEIVVWAYKKEN